MHKELYKACRIESMPNTLVGNEPYMYSINGVIQIDSGLSTTHIMPDNLNIPDSEWKHLTENDADETFVRYAKLYIDSYGI